MVMSVTSKLLKNQFPQFLIPLAELHGRSKANMKTLIIPNKIPPTQMGHCFPKMESYPFLKASPSDSGSRIELSLMSKSIYL